MEQNKTIRAAWLFPDILYIHGDRGNLLALERAAKAAGAEVCLDRIDFDTEGFMPMDYDFIFCSPGEIVSFPAIIQWLTPYKAELDKFVGAGKVMLVTGTSQCIFGKKITREDGSVIEGLGLIDCDFAERKMVYGDDLWFRTKFAGAEDEMEIFGSQIQMMDVESREKPFGQLEYGYGNTGKDRNEGSMKNNAVFTNTLGPILVLNPWLTKEIVITCLVNAGMADTGFDFDLDMTLEEKSLATKKEFTRNKVTRLTNCK